MPAVSAADLSDLRLLAPADPALRRRPMRSLTSAPRGLEGDGFPVKRALSGVNLRDLDPFIMMDEMGEVDYAPGEPKGTPWHPHRGFETVTYILDGAFVHADSYGGGGRISNGATQWMTAGSGILHIEAPPEELVLSGGLFHGLQLWVNLPRSAKLATPGYQDLAPDLVPLLASSDGSTLVRLIAGELPLASTWGSEDAGPPTVHGPGRTHTPITFVHATIAAGGLLELPWRSDFNALVYVMSGSGLIGPPDAPAAIGAGQLAVLGPGEVISLRAGAGPSTEVVLLGGQPIREPIAWAGPFVMNTRAELVTAFTDYQAGRFGHPAS